MRVERTSTTHEPNQRLRRITKRHPILHRFVVWILRDSLRSTVIMRGSWNTEENIYGDVRPSIPRPADMLEFGTSYKDFKKYPFQVVGLMDPDNPEAPTEWHVRRKPRFAGLWKRKDQNDYPFTVRLVLPNYEGIFLNLLEKGKLELSVEPDGSFSITRNR